MRSRTLFLLAIIMGIITTLVFAYSFSSKNKETNQPIVTKEVVVSIQTIEENTLVTEEMVTIENRPESSVHATSISTIEDVVGKLTTSRIEANEVFLPARVQSTEEINDNLSKKITSGQRAVSIGVNIVQSVSNLIEAGDFVDVISTTTDETAPAPIVKSSILYSKIRVIAIGQKLTLRDENDELVEYGTVTLEMSPKDTVTLVQASATGSLHLTLHSRVTTTPNE